MREYGGDINFISSKLKLWLKAIRTLAKKNFGYELWNFGYELWFVLWLRTLAKRTLAKKRLEAQTLAKK